MGRDAIAGLRTSFAIAIALCAVAWPLPERARAEAPPPPRIGIVTADFGAYVPRADARIIADWIVRSGDAHGRPFVIVDKVAATIYVFGPDGRIHGAAPVLLGQAIGDHTVPGIGERPIKDVQPHERTTPAGRFIGQRGRNARGEDVVWVDYDTAVSMHRVLTTNRLERRLERLATPAIDDNRISYGCINLPREFFEAQVAPLFAQGTAPIYVLPEVRAVAEVFPMLAQPRD